MSVLHICSDFAKQTVYCHLVANLAATGLAQTTFAPVRTDYEMSRALELERQAKSPVALRKVLTPLDRVFFRRKVRKVLQTLESAVELRPVNLVHAHFLYSDGAVALQLSRTRKLPFVVSVRNTDVNAFLRLRPDLRGIAGEILVAAKQIIFITPSYVERVLAKVGEDVRRRVEFKVSVVPNGIPSTWLQESCDGPTVPDRSHGRPLRILYVGDLSPNKNLRNLVRAIEILNCWRPCRLTLVGSGGADENWVRTRVGVGDNLVEWKGRLSEPDVLQHEYRQHDLFAMPSLRETFGVVYLEALSQGLPILHSRGEGVDGYFDGLEVAEGVDPRNPQEIAEKLAILSGRLPQVCSKCRESARRFEWRAVAQQYHDIYRNVLRVK